MTATSWVTQHEEIRTPANPEAGGAAIDIRNVSQSFGTQKVLDGISLQVRRGETLVVLGRSGTGKSVLLKIIVGLQRPDQGSAFILGSDMNSVTDSELSNLRMQMGFLFQHAALYDSLTVVENVAFPLTHHKKDLSPTEIRDRAEHLLQVVGLEGHSDKMPANISGGMQKRVGVARALALDPVILLLDEPTAGLDPIGSEEIDDLIQKLQTERKLASVLVTHDLLSAKNIATHIALLDKGKIVIGGSFEDLKKSEDQFVAHFFSRSL